MKHIFAFLVASILLLAVSASAGSGDPSVENGSVHDEGCSCINDDCGCCQHIDMSRIGINGTVCTNFTYLRTDYGISITITYNNYTVFNETVSARNPPPMCFGIPEMEKIHAAICMRFYDLTFAQQHFHGCAKLTISVYHMIHKSINLGCFNIPKEELVDVYATKNREFFALMKKELEELEYLKNQIPYVNMI